LVAALAGPFLATSTACKPRIVRHAEVSQQGIPGSAAVPLPEDGELRPYSREDPALERYLAKPPERRRDDLFLYRIRDRYWLSEYESAGRPVGFTCHFILHFEEPSPGQTTIEVLEYQPTVNAGRRLGFARHGAGLGRVDDLRLVPPTTRDRVELLRRFVSAIPLASAASGS
jgi:hypothetical protein